MPAEDHETNAKYGHGTSLSNFSSGQICDKHAVDHVVNNAQKAVEQFLLANEVNYFRHIQSYSLQIMERSKLAPNFPDIFTM